MFSAGGAGRTVFRLILEMEKLEATFQYESSSAAPLALVFVEDFRFNLDINPGTLRLTASLGNMLTKDGALPDENPYRRVCDLRAGSATSLIDLEFSSHTAEESRANPRVPDGFPYYALRAQLNELDVVFLYRFLQETLEYISMTLALRPPLLDSHGDAPSGASEGGSTGGGDGGELPRWTQEEVPGVGAEAGSMPGKRRSAPPPAVRAMGFILLLDLDMDAPVITMPRHSESMDEIEVDLGSLHLSNTFSWSGGSSVDNPSIFSRPCVPIGRDF